MNIPQKLADELQLRQEQIDNTIALLDDMADKGVIRGNWRDVIEVADNLEELAKMCI